MKRLTLFFLTFIHLCLSAQVKFTPRVDLALGINWGMQENAISLSLNASTVVQYSKAVAEFNAGASVDFFLSRYGAFTKGVAFNPEGYGLIGFSKHSVSTPFYSGDFSRMAIPDTLTFGTFSGIGIGVKRSIIKGWVKHLANQQGILLLRLRTENGALMVKFRNDFKAGFMLGSGTDQGETGSFHIGYTFADSRHQLHSIGLNLELFTPQPDYSRNPTNPINSDHGSRPVLYATEPYSDLFHGNLYFSYLFSSPYFSQYTGIGIDNQWLGGTLQNMLHDSFGLYPRFGWNKEAASKLYFQSKSNVIYGR